VRAFLAVALVLTMGFAAMSAWDVGHARHKAVSSSQIFIHGTPVCVTQHGGEIVAAIGECSTAGERKGEEFDGSYGGKLPPGHPPIGLPPGHPPIDSNPGAPFEGSRRTLI